MIYDLVWDIVSWSNPQNHKRAFSWDVKDELWHEWYKCSYCWNIILSKEDAEVDHIVPYSKWWETSIENAQLLHKLCNREKSAKINECEWINWDEWEDEE
jgi:5-methylcytosine-specific restriction endonuclease McrA